MVQYHVHVTVRSEVFLEYLAWLRGEHIQEVLMTPGFIDADLLYNKAGALESSSYQVKIIYRLESENALKSYLNERALALREKGLQKFPGQFSAQREIWYKSERFTRKAN